MNAPARCPVTVVIPAFRASGTLARALASVAAQTSLPEEVLVIDDGNPPDEAARLCAVAAGFPDLAVQLVRLERNVGAGGARNAGWARARAPLLALLDADDSWHPQKLALQSALMLRSPAIALSAHPVRVLAEGESLPQAPRGTGQTRDLAGLLPLIVNPATTPSWMIRTSEAIRFAEGKRHVEDHHLLMELLLRGRHLRLLDLELGALHKPSLSRSGLSSQLWAMELGELDAYARVRRERLIGAPLWAGLSALSLVKFVRRALVVKLLR
jgi:glycosyltransferase involved in cell wall biosynthesis